jgi:hypothetical protein
LFSTIGLDLWVARELTVEFKGRPSAVATFFGSRWINQRAAPALSFPAKFMAKFHA